MNTSRSVSLEGVNMFGFSIYLGETLNDNVKDYIQDMAQKGFQGIFTSLHIPEEGGDNAKDRLVSLANIAKLNHLRLMVDIAGEGSFFWNEMKALTEAGVTGLRIDDDISMVKVAQLSHQIRIGLNASTVTVEDLEQLKEAGADFSHLEAWHNFYPRPETGLDPDYLRQKNQLFAQWGIKVTAFVAGDANLRGPIFSGLPTLESNRYQLPFVGALELKLENGVENIYIGDPGLAEESRTQFQHYIQQQTIILHAERTDSNYWFAVEGEHINRKDVARDCLRSATSRQKKLVTINAEAPKVRLCGAVTIDNQLYGRYMGEIEVTKVNLPADKRVNVVGYVNRNEIDLLPLIGSGQKFKIMNEVRN